MLINSLYLLEPLIFIEAEVDGSGFVYNLDALTMIDVTDAFMQQDESVRKCGMEPLYNCTTRKYLDALLDQCGCLPLSINKVVFDMYLSICNTSLVNQKNT